MGIFRIMAKRDSNIYQEYVYNASKNIFIQFIGELWDGLNMWK